MKLLEFPSVNSLLVTPQLHQLLVRMKTKYILLFFDLRVHSEEDEKPEALGAAMKLSVEDIGLDEYDENSIGAEQSISVTTLQDGQLVASALVPTDGSDSPAEEHSHVSS